MMLNCPLIQAEEPLHAMQEKLEKLRKAKRVVNTQLKYLIAKLDKTS